MEKIKMCIRDRVMPVEKIGAMIQEKCPKALYHVDAIQAFGKYPVSYTHLDVYKRQVVNLQVMQAQVISFFWMLLHCHCPSRQWVVSQQD